MYSSRTLIGIMTLTAISPMVAQAEAPEEVAMESSSAASSTPSTPSAEYPDPMDEPEQSRFRWGIAANGGPMMGAYSGGAGGLDARFGMQLSSVLGFYAQPTLMVGAGASVDNNSATATGLALYGMGAMVDATLGDLFYVAGGPELLLGGVGSASASSTTASTSSATGTFFSVAGRTGFAFGSKRPDRRKAFTLGMDMHVLFAGGATFMPMLALGYEAF